MTLHLVIDCETSGLFNFAKDADAPGQPRLCQIGMIWVRDDLSTVAEAEWTIKPKGWTVEPDAVARHGLTQELLEEIGGPIEEALMNYAEAIDRKHIIVGYNAPFDIKMMRAELRHAGMKDRYMQTRTLDVMNGCRDIVNARTEDGRRKAPTLDEACAHFGLEREPMPHRALGGARAALEILRKLRELGKMPAYRDPYDKAGTGKRKAKA